MIPFFLLLLVFPLLVHVHLRFFFCLCFILIVFFLFFPTSVISSFLLKSCPPYFFYYFFPFSFSFPLQTLMPYCHEPFPSLPFNNALLSTVLLCFSMTRYDRDISMLYRSFWRGLHNGTMDHAEPGPRHGKHRVRSLDRGAPSPPASISLAFISFAQDQGSMDGLDVHSHAPLYKETMSRKYILASSSVSEERPDETPSVALPTMVSLKLLC